MNLGDPELWSFSDVSNWLSKIQMKEYKDIFKESKIDGTMLLILSEDDLLNGLNIENMMHRKRLIRALALLK